MHRISKKLGYYPSTRSVRPEASTSTSCSNSFAHYICILIKPKLASFANFMLDAYKCLHQKLRRPQQKVQRLAKCRSYCCQQFSKGGVGDWSCTVQPNHVIPSTVTGGETNQIHTHRIHFRFHKLGERSRPSKHCRFRGFSICSMWFEVRASRFYEPGLTWFFYSQTLLPAWNAL